MALVTVRGDAWDHNRQVVGASSQPELWFRPLATSYVAGLMTNREVKADFDVATGAFTVNLESHPNLRYMPYMHWLSAGNPNENRARTYCEWDPFYPGQGGDISELGPAAGLNGIFYGYGPPPTTLSSVVYFDIQGSPVRIWGPPNAFVEA